MVGAGIAWLRGGDAFTRMTTGQKFAHVGKEAAIWAGMVAAMHVTIGLLSKMFMRE